MATSKIRIANWRGDEFLDKLKAEESKRLERAAIYLKNEIKRDLSVGVKREGGTVTERSQPGEPPRLDEGELRRSMAHEVDGETARVGTNKVYGRHLELGTHKMEKRPFLRPALKQHKREIGKLIAGEKLDID